MRGKIYGFSRASRRRLTDRLMRVPWNDVAETDKHSKSSRGFLITLTYPKEFPQDSSTYHKHLDNFRRALSHVKQGRYGAIWRLEYQKRGAPHYHVLLVLQDCTDLARLSVWVKRVWFRIVGTNDVNHRAWGADVRVLHRRPESPGAMMGYLIKYLGKEDRTEYPTGRCWGGWGELASVVRVAVVFVTYESWVEFCRRVRGWGSWSGYLKKLREPAGIRLFVNGEAWLRRICTGIDGCQIFTQEGQLQ